MAIINDADDRGLKVKENSLKVLVIVPAYNEERNIPAVINDIRSHFRQGDILVVNDGSQDNTSEVARKLGVTVIDLPYNLGIGGAMQTGFLYALREGYDAAIQFDSDGQHRADEISNILEPYVSDRADLVVGSRFHSDSYFTSSIPRLIGCKIFSIIVSVILWKKITDTTSGFRVYGRNALALFSTNYPVDYPEVEALVLAHKRGLRIEEVPAHFLPRLEGESSITALRAFYYMVKVILAIFIDLLKSVERMK